MLELGEADKFTVYAAQACNNLVYIKEIMTMTFFTSYHDIKPYAFDSTTKYDSQTNVRSAIAVSYWGFTTLTTIGLGDYHPRSDYERILCSVVFLVGVTI